MSERLVQLNFRFNVSGSDYQQAVAPLGEEFAALPGLRWKIWMINEAQNEAGGIYLFEDEESVKKFLVRTACGAGYESPGTQRFQRQAI